MARKKICIEVTEPFLGSRDYYAVGCDENGQQVAYAFGNTRQEVISEVVQKARQAYGSDADIVV